MFLRKEGDLPDDPFGEPPPKRHFAKNLRSKGIPLVALPRMIPNILTLMALTAGVTSVQMSFNERYETAVMLLLLAAVLDVLDGAVARLLKASSEFGAELDSFSDFLSFGVAPALVLYSWCLEDAGKLGWIATVALPAAAALRLARFNVMSKKQSDDPLWKRRFFTGVPAPAGAGLALLPVFIWIQSPETFEVLSFANPLVALWLMFVGALMVSRLPTLSLKYIRVPAKLTMPILAFAAITLAALVHAPWITLTLISLIYLASVPVGYHTYRKLEKKYANEPEEFSDLAFGAIPEESAQAVNDGPGPRANRDDPIF